MEFGIKVTIFIQELPTIPLLNGERKLFLLAGTIACKTIKAEKGKRIGMKFFFNVPLTLVYSCPNWVLASFVLHRTTMNETSHQGLFRHF